MSDPAHSLTYMLIEILFAERLYDQQNNALYRTLRPHADPAVFRDNSAFCREERSCT